jgi:hypothetical protein
VLRALSVHIAVQAPGRSGRGACARKPTEGARHAKPSRGVGRSWLVGETLERALAALQRGLAE